MIALAIVAIYVIHYNWTWKLQKFVWICYPCLLISVACFQGSALISVFLLSILVHWSILEILVNKSLDAYVDLCMYNEILQEKGILYSIVNTDNWIIGTDRDIESACRSNSSKNIRPDLCVHVSVTFCTVQLQVFQILESYQFLLVN